MYLHVLDVTNYMDLVMSELCHVIGEVYYVFSGTHYVQDINVTGNHTIPGQVDIQCDFVVNSSKTLGYLAIVYSPEEVKYLVTENRNEGVVVNNVNGLNDEEYSTLLYAINEKGIPLNQAAGFPSKVPVFRENQGNFQCFPTHLKTFTCYSNMMYKNYHQLGLLVINNIR